MKKNSNSDTSRLCCPDLTGVMSGLSPWNCLARLASEFYRQVVESADLVPICQGASGRSIARIRRGEESCIGIYWTDERADNRAFPFIAELLARRSIRVPAILTLRQEDEYAMALVEDLGDTSILSLDGGWDEKLPFYKDALVQLHRLHHISIDAETPLQPPFDENLYRWEQEYFAQFYLKTHLGMEPSFFLNHSAGQDLATRLASLPRVPVHRDFQSQNIHIREGKTWFIDFQGLRLGLPEYDLASLVHDPYMRLLPGQKEELLSVWEEITDRPVDRDVFLMCSLQRVMQALGAYGKLVAEGNAWYAPHIGVAREVLNELGAVSSLAEPLSNMIERPVSNQ